MDNQERNPQQGREHDTPVPRLGNLADSKARKDEDGEQLNSSKPFEPFDQTPHRDILNELLYEIRPIDFVSLIRPQVQKLRTEYDSILQALESGDKVLFETLNEPKGKVETSRTLELEVMLKAINKGIRQKHYVVSIITELLKIAVKCEWDLCQCYDYVYIYNGAYWKQLNKDDLKYFLGEAAKRFGYAEIDAEHHYFKDELLKQFITQAHLTSPEPDPDRILINLQNGTFEFIGNKGKLRAFNHRDFITYQLPFRYDPKATCPRFDSYLLKVLPDTDSRLILQEFCGFIFTNLNLEKCLVLTGDGSNGKSVFFNILTTLIGKENTLTYTMNLFNHEYNRAKLTNVLLNYSSEKGTDLDIDTFKGLISGEPLQAREPYGKSFTLYNKVKFMMNCNELPRVTESTEAYFRRYLIIQFDVIILEAERDINLADKIIKHELPGVFNWLLLGLERLVRQNKFTESEKVNNAIDEFRRHADNVALFIDELKYRPSEVKKKSLADLFSQYKHFCFEDNYKPLGKNKFSHRLVSKGFESCRLNDGSTAFFIEA